MSYTTYIYSYDKVEPIFVMLVGLPGSGKSFYADRIECNDRKPIVHSSDKLREELFGDVNEQSKNDVLFKELHKRIKDDLKAGRDVVYDATNIDKKKRIAFLNELKNVSCFTTCLFIATPYDVCLKRNQSRERKVPEFVIERMYKQFCPPHKHEGFDYVTKIDCDDEPRILLEDIERAMAGFDQENEHHTLDLLGHSEAAVNYILNKYPYNSHGKRILVTAARFHDCGKLKTKSKMNSRGVYDGNSHYYNHNNVSAYDFLVSATLHDMTMEDAFYIANLLYLHMMPYLSWKQSEKAKGKWIRIIGYEMYDDVMVLHEADLSAH